MGSGLDARRQREPANCVAADRSPCGDRHHGRTELARDHCDHGQPVDCWRQATLRSAGGGLFHRDARGLDPPGPSRIGSQSRASSSPILSESASGVRGKSVDRMCPTGTAPRRAGLRPASPPRPSPQPTRRTVPIDPWAGACGELQRAKVWRHEPGYRLPGPATERIGPPARPPIPCR